VSGLNEYRCEDFASHRLKSVPRPPPWRASWLYQLIWIFADLASGFFSTVTSSTPSL